ncbi:MAG TPA: ComF family protein [Candidatus Atribacteria bacterium]|nr:ComF family protein [Candidatus Atribacteria bacterium]
MDRAHKGGGRKNGINLIISAALDLIYPRVYCELCGSPLEKSAHSGFCGTCHASLPFIAGPRCHKCGKPLKTEADRLCPDCFSIEHAFEAGLPVFEYIEPVRGLVHRYKYDREYHLGRSLAYFMAELYRASGWKAQIAIPVPLHKNKLKTRGFNQALLLAEYLAHKCRIACLDGVLVRRVDTGTQTRLSRREREENLRDAFHVVKPSKIAGKDILLIDDIYTTGATVDNCSKALKNAGAGAVYVLTLATGRNI